MKLLVVLLAKSLVAALWLWAPLWLTCLAVHWFGYSWIWPLAFLFAVHCMREALREDEGLLGHVFRARYPEITDQLRGRVRRGVARHR